MTNNVKNKIANHLLLQYLKLKSGKSQYIYLVTPKMLCNKYVNYFLSQIKV